MRLHVLTASVLDVCTAQPRCYASAHCQTVNVKPVA